jgi:hypothetical protein
MLGEIAGERDRASGAAKWLTKAESPSFQSALNSKLRPFYLTFGRNGHSVGGPNFA